MLVRPHRGLLCRIVRFFRPVPQEMSTSPFMHVSVASRSPFPEPSLYLMIDANDD